MNELTPEDKKIIIDLLLQISLPVSQSPVILQIIDKLKTPSDTEKTP